MFSTTRRTLEADSFLGTMLGLLLVVGLLAAWGAWFLGAEVTLYAASSSARLEMSQAAHPVEAPVAGRVIASYLVLDRLFRGFFDLGRELSLARQRLGALGVLLGFIAALLLLELPIATGLLRLGRHLEARLRLAFLAKIPHLGDRYFQSRLTSDMAERSHTAQ